MKKILLIRLWDDFIYLIKKHLEYHEMTQQELADLVGMQRSHLNALLNKSEHRPLTAYYLLKFIRKGIIKLEDIMDEKATDEREIEFWLQAKEAENLKLLGKIARLRKKGVDIEGILDKLYPDI